MERTTTDVYLLHREEEQRNAKKVPTAGRFSFHFGVSTLHLYIRFSLYGFISWRCAVCSGEWCCAPFVRFGGYIVIPYDKHTRAHAIVCKSHSNKRRKPFLSWHSFEHGRPIAIIATISQINYSIFFLFRWWNQRPHSIDRHVLCVAATRHVLICHCSWNVILD